MLILEQSLFIIPTKKAAKSEQPHVKWSDESERKRVTKGNIHKFATEAHKQYLNLPEEEKQRLEEVRKKEKLLYLREHRNIKRVFDQERRSNMWKWKGYKKKKKKTPEIKIVSKATSKEFVSESDSDSD